jgi:hypothetical protein
MLSSYEHALALHVKIEATAPHVAPPHGTAQAFVA